MSHFAGLMKRFKERTLLALRMCGFGIKAILVAVMKTPMMMVAACLTQTLSFCLYQPAKMELIREEVDHDLVATTLGLSSTLSNIFLSVAVTPLTGYLSTSLSIRVVFCIYGTVAILVGIAYVRVRSADRTPEDRNI